MTGRMAIKYPECELVTHSAVDRALEYFHSIRTPANSAEIHKKVSALIDVGGLMLFRHSQSLLLTALNDEQRAVLAEYEAAAEARRPHEAPAANDGDIWVEEEHIASPACS